VQLLALILYNADGRRRRLDFAPGELNIITGESGTGKSALLTIVEYCLGRSTNLVPVGPISDTVEWYAALWQLDEAGARAFTARPKPAGRNASTTLAMLEFGTALEPPPYEELRSNTDTRQLRQQLGRRIGIEENETEVGPWSLRQGLEANIGHAALLCLQSQSEVASQSSMFHRMGEDGIDQALRDTIPYFLGAVAPDEARKRAQLRDARRTLARLEAENERAQLSARTVDVELGSLYVEARTVGLIDDLEAADRSELVRALQAARAARPPVELSSEDSPAEQDRRLAIEQRRDALSVQLRAVMENRGLLLNESRAAGEFVSALNQQESRLTSLNLIPTPVEPNERGHTGATDCPACGSVLDSPDPTAAVLLRSLEELRAQIGSLTGARPAQRRSLNALDARAASLREELRVAEGALEGLDRGRRITEQTRSNSQDFTRGRIDATLARASMVDENVLEVLRQQLAETRSRVEALEAELDDANRREQLTSRLVAVGRDIKRYAEQLDLEHSAEDVRLDLARLTVVADTETGPAPLTRIGSAKNWVGYHLATHLALHRYFTRQGRPVPRFLMLDQPTQAHYPSENDNETGQPEEDADRIAVRAMFALMRDVVADLAPAFQIIVCDHADLPESWFQEAVREHWRRGVKLIPADWLDAPVEDATVPDK
jgi:energy-coupling factor transporter ATP-binding protein EcfA2